MTDILSARDEEAAQLREIRLVRRALAELGAHRLGHARLSYSAGLAG